jgi:hypothetical protein
VFWWWGGIWEEVRGGGRERGEWKVGKGVVGDEEVLDKIVVLKLGYWEEVLEMEDVLEVVMETEVVEYVDIMSLFENLNALENDIIAGIGAISMFKVVRS